LVSVILGSCLLSLLHVEDGDAVLHTVPVPAHDNSNSTILDAKLSQRFELLDLDSTNNLSMSYNSKVDNFLVRGNYEGGYVNGNLKFQKENLNIIRRLFQSDPDLLKSLGMWRNKEKSYPVSMLKRQATWHKLLSTNHPSSSPPLINRCDKVLPQESNLLVID
jgi:hypothetical protein